MFFLYADGLIQQTSWYNIRIGITFYRDDFNTDYTYTLPNSRTSDTVNITRTSNVNQPGLWVFKVDNYSIIAGMCM